MVFRFFVALSLLVSCAVAESYNIKVYSDTISSFRYDSLKTTDEFPVGDYEGFEVIAKTSQKDSAHFVYCWQRGYRDNVSGSTIWEKPSTMLDTFLVDSAGTNIIALATYTATHDSDVVKAIDTFSLSGYALQTTYIQPIWSPVARIWAKGLGDNDHTAYSVVFIINCRKYLVANPITNKQPDR